MFISFSNLCAKVVDTGRKATASSLLYEARSAADRQSFSDCANIPGSGQAARRLATPLDSMNRKRRFPPTRLEVRGAPEEKT
jgi:hypothetical protein